MEISNLSDLLIVENLDRVLLFFLSMGRGINRAGYENVIGGFKGGAGTPLPGRPNSFDFMQFS